MLERLQKIIARAGIASRRHAEELIQAGQVRVNGNVVTELGAKADLDHDRVEAAGQLAERPAEIGYYILHKPINVVSTMSDPEGRATLRHLLRGLAGGIFPVGRLDYGSSGLILLTSDGVLADRIFKRAASMAQVYWIKVAGRLTDEQQREIRLKARVKIRLLRSPDSASSSNPANPWYEVELNDARSDVLRRTLFEMEHPVEKMKRVKLGPLDIGSLPEALYRKLDSVEVAQLRGAVDRAEKAPYAPTGKRLKRRYRARVATPATPPERPQGNWQQTPRVRPEGNWKPAPKIAAYGAAQENGKGYQNMSEDQPDNPPEKKPVQSNWKGGPKSTASSNWKPAPRSAPQPGERPWKGGSNSGSQQNWKGGSKGGGQGSWKGKPQGSQQGGSAQGGGWKPRNNGAPQTPWQGGGKAGPGGPRESWKGKPQGGSPGGWKGGSQGEDRGSRAQNNDRGARGPWKSASNSGGSQGSWKGGSNSGPRGGSRGSWKGAPQGGSVGPFKGKPQGNQGEWVGNIEDDDRGNRGPRPGAPNFRPGGGQEGRPPRGPQFGSQGDSHGKPSRGPQGGPQGPWRGPQGGGSQGTFKKNPNAGPQGNWKPASKGAWKGKPQGPPRGGSHDAPRGAGEGSRPPSAGPGRWKGKPKGGPKGGFRKDAPKENATQ